MARSNGSYDSEEPVTELIITPLVDISLVLVIIFMITAPTFLQPSLEITLPKATTGEDKERENVTVAITKDGVWAVNEYIIPFDQVRTLLEAKINETKNKYVIVRVDQDALHKYLIDAMSLCKESGAKNISIAVKPKG
ncbi:MAG: biopolymer transporter ExbD [Elusimicrobia bacterium]|nr:biopolymer transporter ExbD [Candidatus Liberimonas magnetica]